MKVIYARQPIPKSIFLAGPTPRSSDVPSWRPQALELLKGFDGIVFVPESQDWEAKVNYDDQVEWEWEGLEAATVVLFWIPRNLVTMPAFTTNVEYGMMRSHVAVAGWPEGTVKNRYLEKCAERFHIPVHRTLEATVAAALELTKKPF